jgi:hypothetical protein
VRDYRRRHRIRSRNHPVPDLQREGDWLEAPFWAWRAGGRRRGRLFVRPIEGGWELRAGEERWPDLPRWTAAACWRRLEGDGFKIRTRALTTTLFARLLLADLFIHGIGGGKYDELNDAILARHFGVEPPGYLVLTGTMHLPLPGYPVTAEDLRREHREVRDLYWNPQRHLPAESDSRPEVESALAERARLVTAAPQEPAARLARYRRFRELSDTLRPLVEGELSRANCCEGRAAAAVAANAILRRRDYAFCLFPEEPLRAFCTQFTAPA